MSKSGESFVTGSKNHEVKVWCSQTGRLLHEMLGHEASIQCVQLTPSFVISGDGAGVIRVWRMETAVCKHLLRGHKGAITCMRADIDNDDC